MVKYLFIAPSCLFLYPSFSVRKSISELTIKKHVASRRNYLGFYYYVRKVREILEWLVNYAFSQIK